MREARPWAFRQLVFTKSWITSHRAFAQLTCVFISKAAKTVVARVMVTLICVPGWRIGARNAKTSRMAKSMQLSDAHPFFRLQVPGRNLCSMAFWVAPLAVHHEDPSMGSRKTSEMNSSVHNSARPRIPGPLALNLESSIKLIFATPHGMSRR